MTRPAFHRVHAAWWLLAGLGLAGGLRAQEPPDAGALQQQIQRDLPPVVPDLTRPALPDASVAPPPADAVAVTVSGFTFVGNTRLTTGQLQAAVARFTGRRLSFEQLQAAVAAVADAYREAGWVVRAFLPQQELVDGGVVRIEIVEARFGDVRLQPADAAPPSRVAPERLRQMVYAAQAKGEPLSSRAVDRALLLLNDLPGVNVRGALAAGQVAGETDLALQATNEKAVAGDVRVDNTGSLSTGKERLLGNVAWASPTGAGDLLAGSVLATEGSHYVRLAYRRPVGYDGWSAGASASEMRYELIGADYAVLEAGGSATTVGLDVSYPVIRGARANLSFSAAPEHKAYDNHASGTTTTRYSIDVLPLTLGGNRADDLGRGGSTTGSLTLTLGDVDLDGSPNKAADAITTQTAGSFAKLRYFASRQQTLGQATLLRANLSGQLAGKNLDSAEKFYLGGASGVRAYPSSDGGGSEGHMLNVEVHHRLPHAFTGIVFYDGGYVQVNHDNVFPGAPALNSYELQGAGLALAWTHPKGISARVTWARRIGDNPNATAAGKDQDGTLIENRIWAEASLAF